MPTKEEIERQAEEIERAAAEESESDDEEDDGLLDKRIKQNEQASAEAFTVPYMVVAAMTTLCPTYLFVTVLDLNPLEPVNAIVYLLVFGATSYFLLEAYKQMSETENRKVLQGEDGKTIGDLEKRMNDKAAQLDQKSLPNLKPGHKARTPQEIYANEGKTAEWKTLSGAEQQVYRQKALAEEVKVLNDHVTTFKDLQNKKAMAWSLFVCNAAFIAISTAISVLVLRGYDARVNYAVSAAGVGLLVQLLAKQNDEAARGGRGTAKGRK